jgi:hypothetical protein
MVEENCSPHRGQELKRDSKEGAGEKEKPFNNTEPT